MNVLTGCVEAADITEGATSIVTVATGVTIGNSELVDIKPPSSVRYDAVFRVKKRFPSAVSTGIRVRTHLHAWFGTTKEKEREREREVFWDYSCALSI